ncbi:MAG: cbb3-type cytochrome c oxidase N-terminal domain-containing protein [Pirellulaceae bacterium]
MSETSDNHELSGHVYDGIQEYDNPTPGWWNWLFFATAVHSLFYFIYFHSGVSGRGVIDQYERANAANLRQQFSEIGELQGTRAEMIKFYQDTKWLDVGKVVYQANCITCHAPDGGGLQGPNLTDDAYKNVKQIEDLAKVVADGANNGAMPAWRTRLHPNEVVLVACYVASLRGTSPAQPKEAEGNVIPPWPTSLEESPEDGQDSSETTTPDVSSETPESSNEGATENGAAGDGTAEAGAGDGAAEGSTEETTNGEPPLVAPGGGGE